MTTRRQALAAGAAALAFPGAAARAQAKYPEKPIKLVVPFPPGGIFDTLGRPWAEKMTGLLGTFVVENIGGGGGTLGTAAVARAAPDGYTVLIGSSTSHLTEMLKARPQFDPSKALECAVMICVAYYAIVVHPSVPAQNLKEFIEYAKTNPGKLSYGTAGAGSMNHLTGELMKSLAKIDDLKHVPYRGAGPAINDALGGHVPMIVPGLTGQVLELHRAGKLRLLAHTAPKRLPALADIPAAVETVPDLSTQIQIGIFVPTGTPKPIKEQIATATRTALTDPAYRKSITDGGFDLDDGLSPEGFDRFLAAEIKRWEPIVKAANVQF